MIRDEICCAHNEPPPTGDEAGNEKGFKNIFYSQSPTNAIQLPVEPVDVAKHLVGGVLNI